MAKASIYKHNSEPKDYIREKWIEFASETYKDADHDFGILSFPAEAMQDLHLFKEKGFIDWEEVETTSDNGVHNYKVTKGNIRCFEKKTAIYKTLSQKLIQQSNRHCYTPASQAPSLALHFLAIACLL